MFEEECVTLVYYKRDLDFKMYINVGSIEGSQDFRMYIEDDTHEFWISYAVIPCMFGCLLDATYALCGEIGDKIPMGIGVKIEEECSDEVNYNRITKVIASTSWDDEGTSMEWSLSRELQNNDDNLIIINIEYIGEKNEKYRYKVRLVDWCYAIAKATTLLLALSGISGFHFASIEDNIDIVRFLIIKHIGLTEKIENYCTKNLDGNPFSLLKDELELLTFEM